MEAAASTVVISDTSPIRSLAFLERMDLLHELFGEVLIPRAVVDELRAGRSQPTVDVSDWLFLIVRDCGRPERASELLKRSGIEAGEADAISLAEDYDNPLLIVDDRKARELAMQLGLRLTGTVGVLILAKQNGLLDAVQPALLRLRDENGFFLSDRVLRNALNAAGEAPN